MWTRCIAREGYRATSSGRLLARNTRRLLTYLEVLNTALRHRRTDQYSGNVGKLEQHSERALLQRFAHCRLMIIKNLRQVKRKGVAHDIKCRCAGAAALLTIPVTFHKALHSSRCGRSFCKMWEICSPSKSRCNFSSSSLGSIVVDSVSTD